MNWELFWTALAVLAVYQDVGSIKNLYFHWKLKRDYGDISTILDRITDNDK